MAQAFDKDAFGGGVACGAKAKKGAKGYGVNFKPNTKQYYIFTEEGVGNVYYYCQDSKAAAQSAYKGWWSSRILFGPSGEEMSRLDCFLFLAQIKYKWDSSTFNFLFVVDS